MKVLRLHSNVSEQLALAASKVSRAFDSLVQLEIRSQEAGNARSDFLMRLTWLLCQTTNLKLLSMRVGPMTWFPPVVHLKHLELEFFGGTGDVLRSLPHAEGLQTLSLSACMLGEVVDRASHAPKLCLTALKHLQLVALQFLVPAEISLPESCALSLFGLEERDFPEHGWETVHKHLWIFQNDSLEPVLTCIPTLLCNSVSRLSRVSLHANTFGSANSVLSLKGLAHVERVQLSGIDLYMDVPARVAWKHVVICARNTLDLSFEDEHGFANCVPEVFFYYLLSGGLWVAHLCTALSAIGKKWRAYKKGGLNAFHPQVSHGGDQDESFWMEECFCGACSHCLCKSGVVAEV